MRVLYATALGVPDDLTISGEQISGAIQSVLAERGWSVNRAPDRPHLFLDRLRCSRAPWLAVASEDHRTRSWPTAVARALGVPCLLHQLELRDRAHPESEEGYWFTASATRVTPDGNRVPVETALDQLDPSDANFGDLGETLHGLLRIAIGNDEHDVLRETGQSLYLAAVDLPARLEDLVAQIGEAGAWTLTPMGERHQARVVLPDGSRRLAVLSAKDLEAVLLHAPVPPG